MSKEIAGYIAEYYSNLTIPYVEGTAISGVWSPSPSEYASCCETVKPIDLFYHCLSIGHTSTRVFEKPRHWEKVAMAMTLEEAPLHINDSIPLLKHVALRLLGR